MANTPSSNGKGSARRRENLAKVRENWDLIDWSKGKPAAKPAAKPAREKVSEASFFLRYDPHLSPEENDLNEQMQEDDLRDY